MDFVNVSKKPEGAWYSKKNWFAAGSTYVNALCKNADVNIIHVPHVESSIDSYVNLCDGLLFMGGSDLDASLWGESQHPSTTVNHERLSFEFKLMSAFLKTQKPLLGICLGMQLLNVIRGGSNIQHIPEAIPGALNHKSKDPDKPAHEIHILKGSKLAQINDAMLHAHVNTDHHQAINQLGQNLIKSAWADDGVIEAIEATDHPFALGIQWHPERLVDQIDCNIFKYFGNICGQQ